MSQKIICDGLCEPPMTFPVEYEKQTEWRIMSRATSMPSPATSFHLCPSCWAVLVQISKNIEWHPDGPKKLRFSEDTSL